MTDLAFDNNGDPLGCFEQGVDWTIARVAETLGINANDFSWDAATEEWEGDVNAVIRNMLTAAPGEDVMDAIDGARRAKAALERVIKKEGS